MKYVRPTPKYVRPTPKYVRPTPEASALSWLRMCLVTFDMKNLGQRRGTGTASSEGSEGKKKIQSGIHQLSCGSGYDHTARSNFLVPFTSFGHGCSLGGTPREMATARTRKFMRTK